jgi:hypothetical protein
MDETQLPVKIGKNLSEPVRHMPSGEAYAIMTGEDEGRNPRTAMGTPAA